MLYLEGNPGTNGNLQELKLSLRTSRDRAKTGSTNKLILLRNGREQFQNEGSKY